MVAATRIEGLAKSFGATTALRPLDLEVPEGESLPRPAGVYRFLKMVKSTRSTRMLATMSRL